MSFVSATHHTTTSMVWSTYAVGAAYVIVSSMMVVVNKAAMNVFPWPTTLSAVQFLTSAVAVWGAARCGLVSLDLPLPPSKLPPFLVITFGFTLCVLANQHLLAASSVTLGMSVRGAALITTACAEWCFLPGTPLPSPTSWLALGIVALGTLVYSFADVVGGDGGEDDIAIVGASGGPAAGLFGFGSVVMSTLEGMKDAAGPAAPLALVYLAALTFETTYVKHVFNNDSLGTRCC